ncbi:chaperone required for assembly of F1-ATPase [Aliiruegeria haliotis]|uniref:Chaperone required for assembly of F1-ATPase n=1 Tax=Aliiruegeria haliotis TaxID=1280846 RepID=A0A2T0RPC0_9RHOB|nr:ATP12 family protein [Aliiruegeria haliotis]PRY22981.1 chaperone required for assembly of F1-ATPase [Aliiruegeria haliotis]
MAEWKVKRFWKQASAVKAEDGWAIALDGRQVRTPAKALLVVPSLPLAEAIAAEWDAQEEQIDPLSMPLTRSANAAIDKVGPQFSEVAELIAAYGDTDLCCYRAEGPERLCARQAEAWNPLLDWARVAIGVELVATVGVIPTAQATESLERLRKEVAAQDAFTVTALHDLVSLSGSLLIGLAALQGAFPVEDLWFRSRIDETFQEGEWGVDDEAAADATRKRDAFLHAARFLELSRATA